MSKWDGFPIGCFIAVLGCLNRGEQPLETDLAALNAWRDRAEVVRNQELMSDTDTAIELLKAMHSVHRAFSGNDNWTSLDDDVRERVERFLDSKGVHV